MRCFAFDGSRLDTRFYLSFTDGATLNGAGGPGAYLFANKPTAASYHPTAAFRYSSHAGATPRVSRTGVGRYSVKLPGMTVGGVAEVTAFGAGKSRCQLTDIRTDALPQVIGVRCTSMTGAPKDSRFYLSYVTD